MRKIVIAPTAAQDIEEAWQYIARDNPAAAERWRNALWKILELLAEMPTLGRNRPEFSMSLQSFTKQISKTPYVIFYEAESDEMNVMRILHHARDIKAQLN